MRRCIFLSLTCLAFLQAHSAAQDIQARGQALLQHSRQLSDIRSVGAPAFRLKATFSFTGDDLEETRGTYTETWISDSQWRRETVIGDLHYIDIAAANKRWLIYPDLFPTQAEHLPSLMTLTPPASLEFDFTDVRESAHDDLTAECAYSKPILPNRQSMFCFEKHSGVLLEKAFPERRPRNVVMFSCQYGTFRKFSEYYFPREMACFEDRHKSISASVVELSLEPPVDPALFTAPAGAIELGLCLGKSTAPRVSVNEFTFHELDPEHMAWIKVWFVVDAKGKPQNVRVVRSTGKASHERTLETVRNWRFFPGTCDGKPIPMQMTMEVPSTPK